jgi:hypothetical protein
LFLGKNLKTIFLIEQEKYLPILLAVSLKFMPHGDSNTIPSMGAPVVIKTKHARRHVLIVCPFADLFRTTSPEMRRKYSATG